MPHYTPTETKILGALSDGKRHTAKELVAYLYDDMGSPSNVRRHILNIRKKLKPVGQHIVCEYDKGRYYYRQVRLLGSQ